MKLFKSSCLSAMIALFAAAPSFAAAVDMSKVNIDGLIGLDLITGGENNSTSNIGFGARAGYSLNKDWETGVAFTTTSNSTMVNNFSVSSRTSLLLADLNYHLPNEWNSLYFGVRLGLGLNSGSTSDTTAVQPSTATDFAYGFVGGYDHKVAENFTIGPRLSYTLMSHTPSNLGDFQAHAAFKYFF